MYYSENIQRRDLSVQTSSSTNNDTLKVVIAVQQVITELSEAVSEKDKIMVITKMALNKTKWLIIVHRPLKFIAFNANATWRRRYELSKQLQDLHMDVALLSEIHLKPHERFFIPNYHFYWADRFPGRIGGTAVAVRKGIPHNQMDLCAICVTLDKGQAYS
jgi:hypothetical protein